jgi:hypothetical protein
MEKEAVIPSIIPLSFGYSYRATAVPGGSTLRKAAGPNRRLTLQWIDVKRKYLIRPEGMPAAFPVSGALQEGRGEAKVFQNEMGRSVNEHPQGDELKSFSVSLSFLQSVV